MLVTVSLVFKVNLYSHWSGAKGSLDADEPRMKTAR